MLSHLDENNRPNMVDIGGKSPTRREAVAQALVRLPPEVLAAFQDGDIVGKKGPVFQTAILAGIMACKKTADLIPLCHPLALDDCKIGIRLNAAREAVIECRVACQGRTGVEMEALTGASVAALTLYDMCKALSHDIVIGEVRLLEKTGGKSDFKRADRDPSQASGPASNAGAIDPAAAPLFGLVLGGGRSSRMRADKAALVYHGKPQTAHCLDLLGAHCAQSFLSCRSDQADQPGFAGHPQIHDTFLDMGPLGGILSALKAHRHAAFLVIACDLPFLDARSLASLVAGRDPALIATAFAGPQDGLPEPMCAIYEPGCYPRALELLGRGISCPRKVILNSASRILPAPDLRSLLNANDPETYQEARKTLAS